MAKTAKMSELPGKANRLKKWLSSAGIWFLFTVVLLLSAGNPALAEKASAENAAGNGTALSCEWKWMGKAPLTADQIQTILAIHKGERPDPATYLDKKYMKRHLNQFCDGVSFVMGLDNYVMYVLARKSIGREDNSCFVMPKSPGRARERFPSMSRRSALSRAISKGTAGWCASTSSTWRTSISGFRRGMKPGRSPGGCPVATRRAAFPKPSPTLSRRRAS